MTTTEFGEYRPIVDADSCVACSKCLRVCPFSKSTPDGRAIATAKFAPVAGIQCLEECGYYLQSHVGYSASHRKAGASGGLTTWFLEQALNDNIIDCVVCVGAGTPPDRLLDYRLITTVAELRSCAGSSYFPVEISTQLQQIMDGEGRYAVVGLPCVIKAVCLACSTNPELARKICLTVALVCGHLPSKAMPDFISLCSGKIPGDVNSLAFRVKEDKCSNLNATISYKDGSRITSTFSELMGDLFLNKLFTQPACECCDDVFGECADVAFMDAWLPEFTPMSFVEGMSLSLVRSQLASNIFQQHPDDNISNIGIDRLIASQTPRITYKSQGLYLRLHPGNDYGVSREEKRVVKPKWDYAFEYSIEVAIDRKARTILRKTWPTIMGSPARAALLYRKLQQILRWKKIFRMPKNYCAAILGRINRLFEKRSS